MKRTLAGLLLAVPVWTWGQEPANSLLWSISGKGLPATSYVYGTVHSKDERAYAFVDGVEDVIRGVNTVAGELDLNATRSSAAAMMGRMMLPDDKKLQDLYKKKDWVKVDAYLKAEMGFMAPMVQRMKPFFVMATLTETLMGGSRPKVVDEYLMNHAKANAHRTIGLETLEEQLAAMDALPIKDQAAMLLEHVERDGDRGALERMLDAYTAQDLALLMTITEESGTMPEAMEKALLTDRNAVMVHRMDSVMRADASAMFLIGAAHLPGASGVLQLLRAQGYTVEAMPMPDPPAGPAFGPATSLKEGIHYVNDSLGFGVDMLGPPTLTYDAEDLLIGHKHGQGGVMVLVIPLSSKEQAQDLSELVDREFEDTEVQVVGHRTVQGFEARQMQAVLDGSEIQMLLVRRGERAFIVNSVLQDTDRNGRVLESFHFTDLPK